MKKNKKAKTIFKIIGLILAPTGLILTIIGISSMFNHNFNNFFLSFIGMPLMVFGILGVMFGFMREINTFVANENIPVANKIIDGTRDSIVKTGQKMNNISIKCLKCGKENKKDANFCSECGCLLVKTCPHCQNENDVSSKFCNNCGNEI